MQLSTGIYNSSKDVSFWDGNLRSCLKTRNLVTPASGWLSGRHLADRFAPYQIKFERCAGGTRRATAGEDAGATLDERVFKQLLTNLTPLKKLITANSY
jgi:hypothetical protein